MGARAGPSTEQSPGNTWVPRIVPGLIHSKRHTLENPGPWTQVWPDTRLLGWAAPECGPSPVPQSPGAPQGLHGFPRAVASSVHQDTVGASPQEEEYLSIFMCQAHRPGHPSQLVPRRTLINQVVFDLPMQQMEEILGEF